MYHVTNVPSGEDQPNWTEIRLNVADDSHFDGDLLDLPVACFTTTLFNGGLPTQSPYPRLLSNGKAPEKDAEHWRVDVSFNLDGYTIFDMNCEAQGQIHLLCLNKNEEKGKLLAAMLDKQKLANLKKYFPNDKANEYTDEKCFVNVSFINPVSLTNAGVVRWTKVKKDKSHRTGSHGYLTKEQAKEKLLQWGEVQLQSSWRKCLTSLQIGENLKQIKIFMIEGKEALQKKWKDLILPLQENREAESKNKTDVSVLTKALVSSKITQLSRNN